MKIYLKIINVGIIDSFVKISQILPVKFIIIMVIITLPHKAISCLLVVKKKERRKYSKFHSENGKHFQSVYYQILINNQKYLSVTNFGNQDVKYFVTKLKENNFFNIDS